MKNGTVKWIMVVVQAVFLMALCTSCTDPESRKQEAEQQKPAEPAPEKPQAAEAPRAQQQDDFSTSIKESLEKVSRDMSSLKKQVETYAADTMDAFEQDMVALADRQQQAYTQLKQLPDKTGAMLDDARKKLSAEVGEIERTYRTIYEKYSEKILKEFSGRIEALKNRSEEMAAEGGDAFQMQMQQLADKEQQAYDKLKQLPEETGQAWSDLKKGLDGAVDELAELYNRTLADEPAEKIAVDDEDDNP